MWSQDSIAKLKRKQKVLKTRTFRTLEMQALAVLRNQNQDAFFGLIARNLNKLLPVIYTPTVGEACKQWSRLMQRPQGLYISIRDKVQQMNLPSPAAVDKAPKLSLTQ